MTRKDVLAAAEKCVCGDREQDYGRVEDNFKTIARFWEIYLENKCLGAPADIEILPEDVAAMMALLKIARITSGNIHPDNWIDGCGYLACGGELEVAE